MLSLKKIRESKGFTLVELLVVIAIIGTLATLLLLQLGVARAKARDTKRIADVNQLRSAVELYFDDNGSYPVGPLTIAQLGKYLTRQVMPMDPLTTSLAYKYAWNPVAAPTRFHLWTNLEQKNLPALTGDSDLDSSTWTGGGDVKAAPSTDSTTGCTSAGSGPGATSPDCIYDVGQN